VSTVVARRSTRRPEPPVIDGPVDVDAPPEDAGTARKGVGWSRLLMTLPMLGAAVAMALMVGQGGGGAATYLVGGLFAVSGITMLINGWGGGAAAPGAELAAARRTYLRYLAGLRSQLRDIARRQHHTAHHRHPDPRSLWAVAGHRLWERRRTDSDFGEVRAGVGTGPLAVPLRATDSRQQPDPATAAARQRLLDTYAAVADLPVTLPVTGHQRVILSGHLDVAAGLARTIVAQLATFHSPDDLRVAVCAGPSRRVAWEWVKWLPHAGHPTRTDAVGPVRLVAGSMPHLAELVTELVTDPSPDAPGEQRPHLLIVHDSGAAPAGPPPAGPGAGFPAAASGVTLLDVAHPGAPAPGPGDAVCEVDTARLRIRTAGDGHRDGTPEVLSVVEAEVLARRLAPLRPPAGDLHAVPDRPGHGAPDLTVLFGTGDPRRFDPATGWRPRPVGDRLRVPIGAGEDGTPVLLDLKESAAGGAGPHGLLIGATGSGKSELLRTLVLSLAATHSSEELNLVLVDFKGGATFAPLERLPHTAAVITNLADELPLVDRMTDALNGELVRRQELLRQAGNCPGRAEYVRARADGAALPPLPVLLVVCDEFSELLAARPDFIELFVQIGRVGRSLGVHLLLASQRLEEGRLRGLDTHLSYRIGLRTFSALESRAVLGVPDAYELPRAPGHGYLRCGTDPLVRFRAAYVSGPAGTDPPAVVARDRTPQAVRVLPYGTRPVPPPVTVAPPIATATDAPAAPSVLDLLVDRMVGAGPPAHRVWLPPLADPPALDELLGPLVVDPVRGLTVADPDRRGRRRVPVGWVDRPLQQRRELLLLALDGAAGHVAVAGAPRTGKSTLLVTLICGLALTHTPAEAQVYCLDFGGGSLARLRDLPHVGGVAGRLERAAVRRTVGEVAALLAARESAGGENAGGAGGYGDVFLVVDGWATLRNDFEDLEPVVTDLAARGLSYGVHVVVAATRWLELRPALRDLLGSRVELRLGDPSDSLVGRRAAATVPEGVPGRGITADGLHLLTALPQRCGGTADLVAQVAGAWTGPGAPAVRLLPTQVPYAQIAPGPAGEDPVAGMALPVGIAETDLRPAFVDLATDPHLVVFGETESGKSSFLRALATSVTRRWTPEQARLVLVDYRRSLLEAVTTPHLIGYGTAAGPTTELIESVAAYLQRRLPGPDVTAAHLRRRSWWTGPECVVIVDDYDLVATAGGNPLLPLLPYLAQARDVGLHLVLARRSGGAGRALYEPVLQRLRDLSVAGLVMSGDPDEGALVGAVRPEPLPPGRARLVTRRQGVRLVQLACPPTVDDAGDPV
jgi:DNA segregation ATPase FtsK/SpoIIIE, S-DNA-T family